MTLTARAAFMKIVLNALLTTKHDKKCVFESENTTYVLTPGGTGEERGGQGEM